MIIRTAPKINLLLFFAFATLFGLAFLRVYLRVQATLIGYEIGKLKGIESEMLLERSELQMTYAKLTTKDRLQYFIDQHKTSTHTNTLAAK